MRIREPNYSRRTDRATGALRTRPELEISAPISNSTVPSPGNSCPGTRVEICRILRTAFSCHGIYRMADCSQAVLNGTSQSLAHY
jgi:hypothetical protein